MRHSIRFPGLQAALAVACLLGVAACGNDETTAPVTTQATDIQLQRAIDTMVALVVLVGDREAGDVLPKTIIPSLPIPATTQTTAPATQTQPSTQTKPSSEPTTREEPKLDLKDGKRFPPDVVPTRPSTTTAPAK